MKKRLGWPIVIIWTCLLLVGCSSSSKNKFVKFIKTSSEGNEFNYDFNLKISDLELVDMSGSRTPNPIIKITETQIKDFSIKGNLQSNIKNKKCQFEIDSKTKILGTEIPIELVGNIGKNNEIYMSTNSYFSVIDMLNSMFDEHIMGMKIDKKQFEGKYIDYTSTISDTAKKEMTENMEPFLESPKKFNQNLALWLSTLESENFQQKEDEVALSLEKKDLIELIKKSETDDNKKEVYDLIDMYENEFNRFAIKHHVNLKTKQQKMEIIMEIKDNKAIEAGFKKMTINLEYKNKDKKVTIKQPDKLDILAMDELFDQVLSQADSLDDLLGEREDNSKEALKSEIAKKDINLNIFTPNPTDDEEVRYESDGDRIVAYVPDYEHYSEDEVKALLGEPSVILDDSKIISEMLSGKEFDLITEEFQLNKLTESQAKAFAFSVKDLSIAVDMGTEVKVWVYEDDKPNVYFKEEQVVFITPKTEYINFKGKIENKKI